MTKAAAPKKSRKTADAAPADGTAPAEGLAPVEALAAPVAEAPVESVPAKYTWATIGARVASPTEDDQRLFGVRRTVTELREAGRQIGSDRVLTDGLRWLGQLVDFLHDVPGATGLVFGFQPGLVRVLHAELRTLRALVAQRTSKAEAAEQYQAGVKALVDDLGQSLRGRYTQRRAALLGAVANEVDLTAKVSRLPDARVMADKLPGAVAALVSLIEDLSSRSDTVGERVRARGFSERDNGTLGDEAIRLHEALELRNAPQGASVDPKILDAQDGVCLTLMGHLLEMFDGAAEQPGVPRLVPIATRGYFGRSNPAPAAPATPAPEPA